MRGHDLLAADLPGRPGHLQDRGRRLDPRHQLRVDRGRRGRHIGDPLRRRRTGSPTPTGSSATRTSTARAARRPWGTWLSGEETDDGMIWECDPAGELAAEPRPLLGVFSHEAAAVDPVDGRLYLTEDDGDRLLLPVHPGELPVARRRRARGGDRRRRRRASRGGRSPTRPRRRPAPRSRTRLRERPASTAARASGTRAASATSRPRATRRSGRTTPRTGTLEVIFERAAGARTRRWTRSTTSRSPRSATSSSARTAGTWRSA